MTDLQPFFSVPEICGNGRNRGCGAGARARPRGGPLRFAELVHLWDPTAPTFAFAGVRKIGLETGDAVLELRDKSEERLAYAGAALISG